MKNLENLSSVDYVTEAVRPEVCEKLFARLDERLSYFRDITPEQRRHTVYLVANEGWCSVDPDTHEISSLPRVTESEYDFFVDIALNEQYLQAA